MTTAALGGNNFIAPSFEKGAAALRNIIFDGISWDIANVCNEDLNELWRRLESFILESRGRLVDITTNEPTDVTLKPKPGSSGAYFLKTSEGGPGVASFEIRYKLKDGKLPFFEVVHEVCHAIYHIDELELMNPESCGDNDPLDDQCNFFAREFFMPAKEFHNLANVAYDWEEEKYNISIVFKYYSDAFSIRQTQVKIRGRELGIWT